MNFFFSAYDNHSDEYSGKVAGTFRNEKKTNFII